MSAISCLLESSLIEYLLHNEKFPSLLFLGKRECEELDNAFGGLALEYMNCKVVLTEDDSLIEWRE